MARLAVFWKALRDLRWQVTWYSLGLATMAVLVVLIYPSYKDQFAEFELPEAMKAFLGEDVDLGTPEGFLASEFFSWMPILLVVFAITAGTSLLAGEESAGTLDILMAQPVSRNSILLQKVAGYCCALAAIIAVTCVSWYASVPLVDMDVSLGRLTVATVNLAPLAVAFGCFALWASVTLPGRGLATGLTTAVAVATFFMEYISKLVEGLEPLAWLTPFYYSNAPGTITQGIDWPKLAVLVALSGLFLILSLAAFQRRDIGVGGSITLPFRRRITTG